MAIKVVGITSGTSFTVPVDFDSLVSIEAIGAGWPGSVGTAGSGGNGGTGGNGGNGGCYALITAIAGISAGSVYSVQIGSSVVNSNSDTWFDSTSILLAKGGAQNGSVGSTTYLGGSNGGGIGPSGASGGAGGGGGGAAGKNGAGIGGGNALGSSGAGGAGDNFFGGFGGTSVSSNSPGINGSAGSEWSVGGSGGGGSGGGFSTILSQGQQGGDGGSYGAGGGGNGGPYNGQAALVTHSAGGPGLIVFTYNSSSKDLVPLESEYASIIAQREWVSWPYAYQGGAQPYSKAFYYPIPPEVDNPPFQYAGRTLAQQAIAASISQPDPWTFNFGGGRQPFDSAKLEPSLLNVNPNTPPFGIPPKWLDEIINIWQPPWPYTFMGGREPYQPAQLNPSLTAVPVINPPFQHPSRTAAQMAIIAMLAQPDPWQYVFSGGFQPFAPARLNPAILNVVPNNPPFGIPPVWLQEVLNIWQPEWPYVYFGEGAPYIPMRFANPFNNPAPENYEQLLRNAIVRARILTYGPLVFDP